MKSCETQAKRRVTLSICGLGMIDESEITDIKTARPMTVLDVTETKTIQKHIEKVNDEDTSAELIWLQTWKDWRKYLRWKN